MRGSLFPGNPPLKTWLRQPHWGLVSRLLRCLMTLLTLPILVGAQASGLHRGYVCEHTETPMVTMANHHHIGAGLHASHQDDCRGGDDQDDSDDRTESHTPLKVELSRPEVTVVQTILHAPMAALIGLITWTQGAAAVVKPARVAAKLAQAPPISQTVARAVVRLI
jgi:hypothetical protein